MQIAPRDTGARYPENTIKNKAMISRPAPTARTTLNHKRLKKAPFLIT